MRGVDRYRAGQHQQVWTEMLGAGAALREDANDWREARLIAEETMDRVRRNVERLAVGLPAIGYRFAHPDRVLVAPHAGVGAEIDRLEAEIGPVPLAFRVFWELVGAVDLSGEHPDWPHEVLDPLMFEASADHYLAMHADVRDEGRLAEDGQLELDFAPDDLHKADVSGGPPYAVRAPDASVDGFVLWEVRQTTFVNYLRAVMRTAGMGGMGEPQHHGHAVRPVPPEVQRLAGELERF
jgi:hypothetical protein